MYYRRYTPRLADWVGLGIAFVHIPKTGGMSIANAYDLRDPGHFTLASWCQVLPSPELAFAVIRNPVDRLRSLWNFAALDERLQTRASPVGFVRSFDSLDDFVRSPVFGHVVASHYFFQTQKTYVEAPAGFDATALQLLRFDHIEADFGALTGLELPHVNVLQKVERREADSHLSPEGLAKVHEFYGPDFELFASLS